MTTFAYLRNSDVKQVTSCDVQFAEIEAACKHLGLDEPKRIEEADTSGFKVNFNKRPLGRWLLATAGKGDTIVFHRLDRCGRTVLDILGTLERLQKNGCRIVILNFCNMTVDLANPMQKIFITFLAGMAELERNLISERTKEALAYRKSMGLSWAPSKYCHCPVVRDKHGREKPRKQYDKQAGDVKQNEWDLHKLKQILDLATFIADGTSWQACYDHCEQMFFIDGNGKTWWKHPNPEMCFKNPVLKYRKVQEAVVWLHRAKANGELPEPFQFAAEQIKPPRGFKVGKRKRAYKPKVAGEDRSAWSLEQWQAWNEESQQAQFAG